MVGLVAWFTGLSGAGKTTISQLCAERLRAQNRTVLILDGDVIRSTKHQSLGFSPDDIRLNNRMLVDLCKEAVGKADVILVPVISPFRDSRLMAREKLGNLFHEVYIRVSLPEAKRRDPKGLYRQSEEGTLEGLIGVSEHVPYEPPTDPEITLDTEAGGPDECAIKLSNYLSPFIGQDV